MHFNAKTAIRALTRTARRGQLPIPVQVNRHYMAEAIQRGRELLAAVPQLTEVVLHVPQLHPTNGWAGSSRRKGERITVTRETKVPTYA